MDAAEQQRLTDFLRERINPKAELRNAEEASGEDEQASAELWINGARRGVIRRDDEDPDDLSYSVNLTIKGPPDIEEAQDRLREALNPKILLQKRRSMGRTKIDDSLELYVDREFMGLVYQEDVGGGFAEFTVEIQILAEDLEDDEV